MSAHDTSASHDGAHHAADHPTGPAALDPDEPHTPLWLTALGGALLFAAALFALLASQGTSDASAPEELAPEAAPGQAAPSPPDE